MNTIIFCGYDAMTAPDNEFAWEKVRNASRDISALLNQTHVDGKRSALLLDTQTTCIDCMDNSAIASAVVIRTGGEYRWNPIHDIESTPQELASRVMAVYQNLMGNTDDLKTKKMSQLLASAIGLHRLVFGYCTLNDVGNVLQYDKKSLSEIYILKWYKTKLRLTDHIEFRQYYRYLINSASMPGRADAVNELVSLLEIFTRDKIAATFCPKKEDINFTTDKAIQNKQVVILYAATIATGDYGLLPQILGILMKLAYQASALKSGADCAMVMSDYQDFITSSDDEFFETSANCRTICTAPGRKDLSAKVGEAKTNKILSNFH